MATITVSRLDEPRFLGSPTERLWVNGAVVGPLTHGGTTTFEVPDGQIRVRAASGRHGSRTLTLELPPSGPPAHLIVRNRLDIDDSQPFLDISLSPESTRGGVQAAYGTYPSPQESAARRASGLRYARFQILFGALVLLGTPVYAALAHQTNPGEPARWGWPIAIGVVFLVSGLVRRRSALRL
jgi:hypothetical protein